MQTKSREPKPHSRCPLQQEAPMRHDLPRISKPVGGLQYMLPLLVIVALSLVLVGWLIVK